MAIAEEAPSPQGPGQSTPAEAGTPLVSPAGGTTPPRPAQRVYPLARRVAVPTLLLLLALVFLSPGLPPRVPLPMDQLLVFLPWHAQHPELTSRFEGGDPLLQQFPWRHWAQRELAAGRFPLWNSAAFGGAPLFAYYQTAVLYPLHLLWVLLPVGTGAGLVLALKLWLGGLGMWFFLRAMGLHWSASLLGALGFMFCGSMVKWLPWAHTNVFLLMPWLAWAVYAWCVQDKRWALPAFAGLLAAALLGGHPENLSIVGISAAIWALGLIVGSPPRRWPRQVGGLAVASLVGLAIGMIQLLPFVEALGLSHIAQDPARAGAWRLHFEASLMMDWLVPRWWGQIYDGVVDGPITFYDTNYVGFPAILGLCFAVVPLLSRKLNLRIALPWLAVGALAWIITYDDAFGSLVRRLPGFSHSINVRWVFSIGFALLVLGALGWDWLARRISARAGAEQPGAARASSPAWTNAGIALIAVGASILIAHLAGLYQQPDLGNPPGNLATPSYRLYWTIWEVGAALGVVGAVMAWWGAARPHPHLAPRPANDQRPRPHLASLAVRAAYPLVVAAFLVADLWMLLFTFNPGSPGERYYPPSSFISQVREAMPPAERVVMEGEVMPANTALVYGVRDWRYQDPMLSERAWRALHVFAPGIEKDVWNWYNIFIPQVRLEVAPLLGIRYVVYPVATNPGYWEPDPLRPPFKRLAFTEGLGLWEMEGVPGFAYLSDRVTPLPGEEQALAWLKEVTWEEARTYSSIVEAPAEAVEGIEAGVGSPGGSRVVEYEPGHIKVEVEAARRALLVVGESYYPGWRGSVDGEEAQILRANYLSQGVVVAEGRHTVELRYEPDSFRLGGMLSVVGLVGLVALAAWARRRS